MAPLPSWPRRTQARARKLGPETWPRNLSQKLGPETCPETWPRHLPRDFAQRLWPVARDKDKRASDGKDGSKSGQSRVRAVASGLGAPLGWRGDRMLDFAVARPSHWC